MIQAQDLPASLPPQSVRPAPPAAPARRRDESPRDDPRRRQPPAQRAPQSEGPAPEGGIDVYAGGFVQ